MKKTFALLYLFLFFITFSSCEKDDLKVPSDLKVNDFIWKGMNLYYLWQKDVPNLADDTFANQNQLNQFLATYSNPSDLFQSLRTAATIDRFSVIFSDYTVLEGILNGNTLNNGVDFGLRYKTGSTTEIFGWVRYILPNSDAATKNIFRGSIFYAVNGTAITVDNYQSLLASTTYTLNLADYNNGNITPNGQSVTVTKTQIQENPVYKTEVINQDNHKIGYLLYNGFYAGYETQLNDAFGNLKSQNITDLVLDLRYNSGGSIATATRLASMITGQFTNQVFAKEQWNDKLESYYNSTNSQNLYNYFTATIGNGNPINKLNLTKVYILTSRSTASASELVINGLKPYIQVIQIGDKTTGKNVGSITLYDSPTFSKNNASTKHKYAMQPLVLKIVNASGFGDYQTGLLSDIPQLEDYGNLGEIGNETEPLLQTAINTILANGRKSNQNFKNFNYFSDSKNMQPLRTDMYTELK